MRLCHHPMSSNARRSVTTAVDLKAKVDLQASVGRLASEHVVKPMIGAGAADDSFHFTEVEVSAGANTEASFSVTRWG